MSLSHSKNLRPISNRRRREMAYEALCREEVFDRDGRACVLAPGVRPKGLDIGTMPSTCSGKPLTYHHLWKAGQRGPFIPANGLTLCSGHNEAIESHVVAARRLGLVVLYGETIRDAWNRMIAVGLVPADRIDIEEVPDDVRR